MGDWARNTFTAFAAALAELHRPALGLLPLPHQSVRQDKPHLSIFDFLIRLQRFRIASISKVRQLSG